MMNNPATKIIPENNPVSFSQWADSVRSAELAGIIRRIYESTFYKEPDPRCDIIRRSPCSTFILRANNWINANEFRYVMQAFGQKLRSLGYSGNSCGSRVSVLDGGAMQKVDNCFLRPQINTDNSLFSSIHLEIHSVDEIPDFLKMTCFAFNKWERAGERRLDKLMEKLLNN